MLMDLEEAHRELSDAGIPFLDAENDVPEHLTSRTSAIWLVQRSRLVMKTMRR